MHRDTWIISCCRYDAIVFLYTASCVQAHCPSPNGDHICTFVISRCLKGTVLSNNEHSVIVLFQPYNFLPSVKHKRRC